MAFPSRWPAGTLAAAGTIPARTMNASATLVFSQGHHPANHRSAIPTRVYESGSGHGHDAAPAGHPHPPRPPPEPGHPGSRALAAHHRLPAARVKAACGVAPGERSAHLDPGHRSHDPWQLSRTRDQTGTPAFPASRTTQPPQTTKNQAQDLQSLDVPLHMSAQLQQSRTANSQVSETWPPRTHDRESGWRYPCNRRRLLRKEWSWPARASESAPAS
jgi:hypothetical protein